jgi:hypothetical protein
MIVASGICIHAEDALSKRFLEEAPKQWAAYRQQATHSEGTCRVTGWDFEDGRKTEEDRGENYSFLVDGEYARLIFQLDRNKPLLCKALNPKYAFAVVGKGDGKWTLRDLEAYEDRSPQTPADSTKGAKPREELPPYVYDDRGAFGSAMLCSCRGMALWATWFPRMVESSDFKLLRVSKAEGKDDWLKVEFLYEPRLRLPNDYVGSGMVVLDTKRYWLIREAKVKGFWLPPQEGTIEVTNEFDDTMMPFPVVKRQVQHAVATDGKDSADRSTVYAYEIHKPVRAKTRCTLSGFGLSEP